MIFLVHGDNVRGINRQVSFLRQKFSQQGYSFRKVEDYLEKNEQEWRLFFRQNSLFSSSSSERFLYLFGRCQQFKLAALRLLAQKFSSSETTIIIFYSYQTLKNRKVLMLFPPKNIFLQKLPAAIFKFLDAFIDGNLKATLSWLLATRQRTPDLLILYWLKRYFRTLYWVYYQEQSQGQKMPFRWQLQKYQRQLNVLGLERIKNLYRTFLDLDFAQRKGELAEGLDLALVNTLVKDYYEREGRS